MEKYLYSRHVRPLDEHVALGVVRPGQPAVVGVTHSLLRPVLVVSLRQPPVLQVTWEMVWLLQLGQFSVNPPRLLLEVGGTST